MTECAESQEILRLSDELKQARREIEQFASIVSHDLQEPLLAITGYLDLVKMQYAGRLDPEAHEWINFASQGSRHLKSLLDDLLDYSRIISRGAPFKAAALNTVFKRAIASLQSVLQNSGAAIVIKENFPEIICDENQIEQVFKNLIENAVTFRGPQKTLIHIEVKPDDGGWVFSVKDNGPGFEAQYASEVFKLFRRLGPALKEDGGGNGAGLAICKKIIDRHQGRIWAESEPGKGAVFSFFLPSGDGLKTS